MLKQPTDCPPAHNLASFLVFQELRNLWLTKPILPRKLIYRKAVIIWKDDARKILTKIAIAKARDKVLRTRRTTQRAFPFHSGAPGALTLQVRRFGLFWYRTLMDLTNNTDIDSYDASSPVTSLLLIWHLIRIILCSRDNGLIAVWLAFILLLKVNEPFCYLFSF